MSRKAIINHSAWIQNYSFLHGKNDQNVFDSDEIKNLSGKRFAIILDEAHSSSSSEMSKSMKRVLNLNKEDDPEEENITWEDEIEKEISSRSRQKNISYFAFTTTPKPKTLEFFG